MSCSPPYMVSWITINLISCFSDDDAEVSSLCCGVEEVVMQLLSVSVGEAALAAAVTVELLASSSGDSSAPGQLRESL